MIIALTILVLFISIIVVLIGYIEIAHHCAELETQLGEKDDEALELKRKLIENHCR